MIKFFSNFLSQRKLKISKCYIDDNIDYDYFQKKLDDRLNKVNGVRNKTVAAAIFLAVDFPKLPYFWGGGHELSVQELKGINKKWGKPSKIIYELSNYYGLGEIYPYSLDCSGFVSWCLVNGGFKLDECLNTTDYRLMGENVLITDINVLDKVNIGDLGLMDGHVGIVISINKKNHEISFVHMSHSGYGIGIVTISTKTGLVTNEDVGVLPEKDKYGNVINRNSLIGKSYFEVVALVPYDD